MTYLTDHTREFCNKHKKPVEKQWTGWGWGWYCPVCKTGGGYGRDTMG